MNIQNPMEEIEAINRTHTKPAHLLLAGDSKASVDGLESLLLKAGASRSENLGKNCQEVLDEIPGFGRRSFCMLKPPEQKPAAPDGINSEEVHLLFLYKDPSKFIADRIAVEITIETALRDWLERTSEVLALTRRKGSSMTLLNADSALNAPVELIRELNLRLSLQLNSAGSHSRQSESEIDSISWLVARYAIQQNQAARLALSELEARSISPGTDASPVSQVIESYRNSARANKEELVHLEKEKELLALQVKQLREELKMTFDAKQDAESTNQQFAKDIDQLRNNLHSVESELNQTRREAESKVVHMAREIEQLKSDLRWTSIQLKDRESNLENISRTLSWRMTAPLRWTLDLFSKN
ncbi:MAG: hypothetical protein OES90_04940 [Xanthomonadales bacterium]|jgi:hypothetical protein|nr:hypothetical protein [Xanthomonadales bacterium]MDH3939935.1 hypothetical protein [Xanthomonadales bacterium]